MPLTPSDIVQIAKVSGYLTADNISNGQIYGTTKDNNLSKTIYSVRKAVEWRNTLESPHPEVKAIGYVTITGIGNDNDEFYINVDDPILGSIQLVEYVKQNNVTNTTEFAQAVINTYNLYWGSEGYELTSTNNIITVTARQGLGASINGGANLSKSVVGAITATVTQFSGGITEVLPSDSLVKTSNYLKWLCGGYGLTAQTIIDGNSGTPVTPVSPYGYMYYSFTWTIQVGESGVNTFSNPILYLGKNVTTMIVNGNTYTTIANDFTFNDDTNNHTEGTITWNTGAFSTGDTITINFSRLI